MIHNSMQGLALRQQNGLIIDLSIYIHRLCYFCIPYLNFNNLMTDELGMIAICIMKIQAEWSGEDRPKLYLVAPWSLIVNPQAIQ